jgi:DNA primase
VVGTALTEHQVGELGRLVGPGGRLHVALDADASGQEAALRVAELAAARGFELDVVVLPGSSDPAELVAAEGADAMRARIAGAIPVATFRVQRILASADLDSTAGRNRAFLALREVLSALESLPEQDELVRLAAGRLRLSERLAGLLTEPPGDGARAPAAGEGGAAAPTPLSPREEAERTFLAMCLALPERGRDALRKVDLEAHFTSGSVRAAAAHLREHLGGAGEMPEGDPELRSLLAELHIRSSREPADPATLEISTLQLEKSRLEREIAAASAEGRPEVSRLAAERQQVQTRIDTVMSER